MLAILFRPQWVKQITMFSFVVIQILLPPCSPFQTDPHLEEHRKDLIVSAARNLDKARMVRFDERTGYMHATDLGRTSSHFYIKYNTVEVRSMT